MPVLMTKLFLFLSNPISPLMCIFTKDISFLSCLLLSPKRATMDPERTVMKPDGDGTGNGR